MDDIDTFGRFGETWLQEDLATSWSRVVEIIRTGDNKPFGAIVGAAVVHLAKLTEIVSTDETRATNMEGVIKAYKAALGPE